MNNDIEIRTVDSDNLESLGFFCYKSKPKSEGYRRKMTWVRTRLEEGMRIKILYDGGRSVGFIEYTPGEFAWRAIVAPDQMVIHCLWIVGSGKGKGYGSQLLEECIADARETGLQGVAMLTSSRTWLAGKGVFLKHGFEIVDRAPPSFELATLKFSKDTGPRLPDNWNDRINSFGRGLTVVYTGQCPYIAGSVQAVANTATQIGVTYSAVELETSEMVRTQSPSAYGVFSVVSDGELVSYHPIGTKDLLKRLTN